MTRSNPQIHMADEPKPESPQPSPPTPPAEGASPSISPAPADVTDAKPETTEPASKASTVPTDPLSDGTVPTVLETGSSHKPVPKGRASITSIYRKADIVTTVITFVVALVAAGAAVGAYAYITRSKTPTTKAPAVTTLDKTDLEKLGSFFEGNSAGSPSQVLTISASSLFKNRVAISSDLKVTGALGVTGATALADLTVDKTSTLGITNIRGQLTVAGPTNFQSPVQLGAGGSVNGNLAVSGNGSYGGSISAATLNVKDASVTGTLNINGHLSLGGQNPSAAPGAGAGAGASASVSGNDSGGTITINTGAVPPNTNQGGALVTLTFRAAYPRTPTVVITPIGRGAAVLQPYVLKTATNFIIGSATDAKSNTSYSFDYWVVQ